MANKIHRERYPIRWNVWFGSVLFLFRCPKHIHGSVDDRQNVYLVWLYVVNDTVGTFDNFSDWINIIFGNSTA
jgi:hypothetical protein